MQAHTIGVLVQNLTTIRGVQNVQLSPELQTWIVGGDGNVHRTRGAVGLASPSVQFSTVEINNALAWAGVLGQAVDANALELYWQDVDPFGSREATSEKITVSKGLIVPVSINSSIDNFSAIEYRVICGGQTDGSDPVAYTSGQTMPAQAAISELFTLGPVTVGGTTVDLVQSSGVEFAPDVEAIHGDGAIFPKVVYNRELNPSLNFTTRDASWVRQIGTTGDAAAVTLKLLACTQNGERAGTGDITITAGQSLVTVSDGGGSHAGDVSASVRVEPTSSDGTSAALAIS